MLHKVYRVKRNVIGDIFMSLTYRFSRVVAIKLSKQTLVKQIHGYNL